ncbi:MAG: hypothetical protein H7Y37_03540 [Anaerolineae bacterium]|nr:hypothetical protein [Gloeobacterales cyanobacterium ES-bin-313]
MKTSYFHRAKSQALPGVIAISRSVPFWFGSIPRYPALAPGAWFKSVEQPEYEQLYAEILEGLEPQQVWNDLHDLADPYEPIILCWESLKKPDQFCHRRFAADWFTVHLGIDVDEFQLS